MRVYYGIDGDRIGDYIEAALITQDLARAEQLSQAVKHALQTIEEAITEAGGRVIFSGGDSLFAELDYDQNFCENLVDTFTQITGCEASAGAGETPLEAFLALRLAKSTPRRQAAAKVKVKVYKDLPKGY